jgi:hypothetical protein
VLSLRPLASSLLAVIKCIYLPPTYLHFIQDIEDKCLLLMSSTSFVDLPFQEHQIMEKLHMDQNPSISSLCQKSGIVIENMTRGNDVAQSKDSIESRCGQPATSPWLASHALAHFQKPFCLRVQQRRCSRYPMPKGGARRKLGRPTKLHGQPA